MLTLVLPVGLNAVRCRADVIVFRDTGGGGGGGGGGGVLDPSAHRNGRSRTLCRCNVGET